MTESKCVMMMRHVGDLHATDMQLCITFTFGHTRLFRYFLVLH